MPNPSRSNALGIHALVWTGDTSDAAIDLATSSAVDTGYDLLELSLHDLDNLNVTATAKKLKNADLGVVCSRGLAFTADVSSGNIATVERGAALLRSSLAATAGLGGKIFTGALYSALGKYPAAVTRAGRANAVGVIRELAVQARADGITLGLEVRNRYETNVINSAHDALALADDIGEGNVMIHRDTYDMNIEEDDLVRPIYEVGDRLGYVHIGENHRGYLGSGHVDFTGFFHALADTSYAGAIAFESFSSSVVAQGLSNDLGIWRELWLDGRPLAEHAHAFASTLMDVSRTHVRG